MALHQVPIEPTPGGFRLDLSDHRKTAVPVIHCTPEELNTERFWAEHLAPITAARGLPEPRELKIDTGDPGAQMLLDPDGQVLAVVRTDRPACPTCGR